MFEITLDQLYEFYLDTIARCTTAVRNKSDSEIQHELFEEFDVGAHTFLHDLNLAKLYDAGYINTEMVKESQELRQRWMSLQDEPWQPGISQNDADMVALFSLGDSLIARAKQWRKGAGTTP